MGQSSSAAAKRVAQGFGRLFASIASPPAVATQRQWLPDPARGRGHTAPGGKGASVEVEAAYGRVVERDRWEREALRLEEGPPEPLWLEGVS